MHFNKRYQSLPIAAKESCEFIAQSLSFDPNVHDLLNIMVIVCVFEGDNIVALHSVRMDIVDDLIVVNTLLGIRNTIGNNDREKLHNYIHQIGLANTLVTLTLDKSDGILVPSPIVATFPALGAEKIKPCHGFIQITG